MKKHVSWAREFAGWVDESEDFEQAAPTPLNLVCFRHRGGDALNERLLALLNESGALYLTHTKLADRYTLRMAIGGTWTEVTQTAAATYDHSTDATNDCIAIYVGADQLSAGYDSLEMTSGTGTCVAIIHDLVIQRNPANLKSSVV